MGLIYPVDWHHDIVFGDEPEQSVVRAVNEVVTRRVLVEWVSGIVGGAIPCEADDPILMGVHDE